MPSSATNGDTWIRTLIGAISAVAVTVSGMYTVVIVPQNVRIEKLETGRETDRNRISDLYATLQETKGDRALAQSERNSLRRDLERADANILRIETEQKLRTTSVTSVPAMEKRIDGLVKRHEDMEHRFGSTYTIGDELKSLRSELADLRRRIMVPLGASSKND